MSEQTSLEEAPSEAPPQLLPERGVVADPVNERVILHVSMGGTVIQIGFTVEGSREMADALRTQATKVENEHRKLLAEARRQRLAPGAPTGLLVPPSARR